MVDKWISVMNTAANLIYRSCFDSHMVSMCRCVSLRWRDFPTAVHACFNSMRRVCIVNIFSETSRRRCW